ncbi:MAG: Cof-type HAD-IIB family hydrolase [Coprobacillus sp.]|nr:Cof-type HAD-IIB family hydrolase [Coprobacillus sp.]
MPKKLLVTDLDGTLFLPRRPRRMISKRNIKFLRSFIDDGNEVVLASSRSCEFMKAVEKKIDRPVGIIASNGAVQVNKNGIVYKDEYFDNSLIKKALKDIEETASPRAHLLVGEKFNICIEDFDSFNFVIRGLFRLLYSLQFSYKERYSLNREDFISEISSGKVYKVMLFFGFSKKKRNLAKKVNEAIREKYPEVESSWSGFVDELSPCGIDKGAAVHYFADKLGIESDNVMVVGDGGNDIPMFKEYPASSFVMKKAPKEVKKYAEKILKHVYNLGDIKFNEEDECYEGE